MSGTLFEILAMDALDDLRNALSAQELKEFDSKYGSLILKIRAKHSKRVEEINAGYEKCYQQEEKTSKNE
jgi:hypothetical protein